MLQQPIIQSRGDYFRSRGISVQTHPRVRSGVSFRYGSHYGFIEVETGVRKVRQDYFVSCGQKYYFDRITDLKNFTTGETVTREMLQEWFPN